MRKEGLVARLEKIRLLAEFVGVVSVDKKGRPQTMVVPGSGGKQYHVIIRRLGGKAAYGELKYRFSKNGGGNEAALRSVWHSGAITLECRLCEGHNGYSDCKGNGPRYSGIPAVRNVGAETICRHSLAVVAKLLEAGRVSFCATYEDAARKSNLGGIVMPVMSHQNIGGVVWLVIEEE